MLPTLVVLLRTLGLLCSGHLPSGTRSAGARSSSTVRSPGSRRDSIWRQAARRGSSMAPGHGNPVLANGIVSERGQSPRPPIAHLATSFDAWAGVGSSSGRLFWLRQFRRLRLRYDNRTDIHEAFLSLCGSRCNTWKTA
jgi:hypothetical protein